MPINLSGKPPKFGEIIREAINTGKVTFEMERSVDWFRQKAKMVGANVTPRSLMSETERHRQKFQYGKMIHYFYDPKWKRILPYYDIFPLIFTVKPARKGFYGINLHYLEPQIRGELMDTLMGISNNKLWNETTKLVYTQNFLDMVGEYKYVKPCFKHYLWKHVQSPFLKIDSDEWPLAIFLPTERFQKHPKKYVWEDSKRIANKEGK